MAFSTIQSIKNSKGVARWLRPRQRPKTQLQEAIGAYLMISANQARVSASKFATDTSHLESAQSLMLDALMALGMAKTLLETAGLSEQYTAVYSSIESATSATFTGIQHCESSLPSESPTHF